MGLEKGPQTWDNPRVKTLKTDQRRRIQLPDAKPGQVFAYENHGDGSITLTAVKVERKEAFPRGSLLKYITPERESEIAALAKGCVQGPE